MVMCCASVSVSGERMQQPLQLRAAVAVERGEGLDRRLAGREFEARSGGEIDLGLDARLRCVEYVAQIHRDRHGIGIVAQRIADKAHGVRRGDVAEQSVDAGDVHVVRADGEHAVGGTVGGDFEVGCAGLTQDERTQAPLARDIAVRCDGCRRVAREHRVRGHRHRERWRGRCG
jgi:hypothetical protein